jgi:predicted MFS family arabinose efflux permease
LTLGWGCFVTSLMISQVALLVWTFQHGGAGLVAAYGVSATLPAAGITPLVTGLAGRIRGDVLLRAAVLVLALFTGVTALAVATGLNAAAVVVLAAAAAALAGTYRPLQAASLPWLVRTPEELSRANVRATVFENAGGLAGPAVGGALVAAASPAVTLAGSTGVMALGLVALLGVRTPERAAASHDSGSPEQFLSNILTGARELLRVLNSGGLVVLALVQTFTRGLLLVLTVVLAVDILALNPAAVGWLNAMIGLGGLAGGAAAGRLLRLARLGRGFVLGVALWGLPLAVLGLAPSSAAAFVALFFVGVGNAVEDGSMFTAIPRRAGPAHAAMALGALELVVFGGVGTGAITAPALARWLGTTHLLAVDGGLLIVLAACRSRDPSSGWCRPRRSSRRCR